MRTLKLEIMILMEMMNVFFKLHCFECLFQIPVVQIQSCKMSSMHVHIFIFLSNKLCMLSKAREA